MCEYCRSYPHLPGCPNEPAVQKPCLICGRMRDEEDLVRGICGGCLKDSYTLQRGRAYAAETGAEFVQWAYGVEIEGCRENRDRVAEILLRDFLGPGFEEDPDRPGMLRDYCLEDWNGWSRFLREAMG